MCVVDRLLEVPGRVGVTAIDKRPVDGPVQVHRRKRIADQVRRRLAACRQQRLERLEPLVP